VAPVKQYSDEPLPKRKQKREKHDQKADIALKTKNTELDPETLHGEASDSSQHSALHSPEKTTAATADTADTTAETPPKTSAERSGEVPRNSSLDAEAEVETHTIQAYLNQYLTSIREINTQSIKHTHEYAHKI